MVELLAGGARMRLARQRWFDPRNLQDNISPDGGSADSPQVALNVNGDAVIVWRQSDGSNSQIFRSEYRNGSWADPVGLSDNISPDGQSALFAPQVALNDNGEAVIVWSQSDGMNTHIFRSEYRNGSWSDPVDLSDNISPDGTDADSPQVALNDNGDAVIVWSQSDGMNTHIFRSEYRNGSWKDPVGLSDNISPGLQEASPPQVALNDDGEAVIVWASEGAISQVFRSEYRNGSWADPAHSLDNISPDGQPTFSPQVDLNNNGEAVIVWWQSDGSNLQIFRSEYRDGSWADPVGLSDNISPGLQHAISPQVALNDNGEAVIVWESSGAIEQIYRSEYRNGSWTDPGNSFDNISPDGTDANDPQVALNDNGDAVIVWRQRDMTTQIFRSEYRNGSWTDPTGLSDNISPDGLDANVPQVALSDNGDAVIVWYQGHEDGTNHQIFRSEFRFGF